MNILITTLGRTRREDGGRYRKLRYRFPNGAVSVPTPFFGLAVLAHLRAEGILPDRIVIMGTSGSMWDAWLETDDALFADNEKLVDSLASTVANEAVTEHELKPLSTALSLHLGFDVVCRVIGRSLEVNEQQSVLGVMAESVAVGSNLWLDVTHGLRHLPLLQVLSAFHLAHCRNVTTRGIYYGAADCQDNGVAPVVELAWALTLQKWVEALAIAERAGNLSALADLPGMEHLADDLRRLYFLEQMNNVAEARKVAGRLRAAVDGERLPPEGLLFRDRMRSFFAWSEGVSFAARQYMQAEGAFDQGDCVRAVLLLHEAVITSAVPRDKDAMNYECRENASEALKKDDDVYLLEHFRNAQAHGTRPRGRNASLIERMRSDPVVFRNEFGRLLKALRQRCIKF